MYQKLLLFVVFVYAVNAASFPSNWDRCKVPVSEDGKRNKCLEDSMNKVIKLLTNGVPSLKIPSFDPLYVGTLKLGDDAEGSVAMRIGLSNLNFHGFRDFKVKSITGKLSSPDNWSIRIKGFVRRLELHGDYRVSGRLLLLPIEGTGKSNITMTGFDMDMTINGKPEVKNGQTYLKLTTHDSDVVMTRIYVKLDNLFNGNRVLGDVMNNMLNENWKILYEQMNTPSAKKVMRNAIFKYAKRILEMFPYNEIFITQ